jgi:uncharacterized protein (TIGR02246 family)
MSEDGEAARPVLGSDDDAARDAAEAVTRMVAELQAALDAADADLYNRHFAADVRWGSPFGATVQGYERLHAIHVRLKKERRGGPSSRYEIDNVLTPAPGVAVAQVRRVALGPGGEPLTPTEDLTGPFSEMAMYVLVRRDGTWWLAAAQNTPIRPVPSPSSR